MEKITAEEVDYSIPVLFRCQGRCHNQFPIERVKADDDGYARCPICDGFLRQLKNGEETETWGI